MKILLILLSLTLMGDPGGGASESARPPPLKKFMYGAFFLLTGAVFSMWKAIFTLF